MSYTIVWDNGTLHVRASIDSQEELTLCIAALEKAREKFPADTGQATKEKPDG